MFYEAYDGESINGRAGFIIFLTLCYMNNATSSNRFGFMPGWHDSHPLFSLVGDIGTTEEDKTHMRWALENLDRLKHPFAKIVRGIIEPLLVEWEINHSTIIDTKNALRTLASDFHEKILETLKNTPIPEDRDPEIVSFKEAA